MFQQTHPQVYEIPMKIPGVLESAQEIDEMIPKIYIKIEMIQKNQGNLEHITESYRSLITSRHENRPQEYNTVQKQTYRYIVHDSVMTNSTEENRVISTDDAGLIGWGEKPQTPTSHHNIKGILGGSQI